MKSLSAVLLAGTLAAASAQTNSTKGNPLEAVAGVVQAFAGTNGQDAQKALSAATMLIQTYAGTNSRAISPGGANPAPANQSTATALAGLVAAFSGPAGDSISLGGTNPSPATALAGLVQSFSGTNADGLNGQNALAAAAKLVQGLSGSNSNPLASLGGKPAIDFRELKNSLPEALAGLRRTNARGEKTSALGATVSSAEGTYGATDGPVFTVKISDLGALGPVGALAGMATSVKEVDSEGDAGYERSAEYRGHRGLEKYSSVTRSGSANVVVANRFAVEITGRGIEAAQLKRAAEELDYAALEKLANPR